MYYLFSVCPLFLCQWNSHGYDVAKVFGSKFTQISPVWLQLKRRGREMFEITGLHDVDQGFSTSFLSILALKAEYDSVNVSV